MTDLQISLLAIGGTIVVGVVIFNKWQEHKAKKSVERAFSTGHDDVLMNPHHEPEGQQEQHYTRQEPQEPLDGMQYRQEPSLDVVSMADDDQAFVPDAIQTEAAPALPAASAASGPAMMPAQDVHDKELPVDELIDCIIPLEFDAPIRGEKILAEIHSLRYVGKKPVHFIGQSHSGERDVIAHGGIYTTLFAGIQMVSRGGPLNELEYSEFVMKLREIADRLNAHPDIPDMTLVMSTARELHQFVSEHDAQLSVNIMANGAPWAINTLHAALEKQGFDSRPDGRLVMPDGDGGTLFSLSTNVGISEAVTARLTLLLDVPCVAPARDGFGAMAACARSLSTRLGGTVVDDGNQPISKAALDEIAGQVHAFYAAMAESEIPAGSTRAQRLFS
ncbi:cell division protein ZipA C-terminal FtsZ-binding domain-containing protein [Undibacterium sp. TJN25]|uniref:cell division protein ZipA C-terminal FtsZ-binding domain-containing protein n=1 Tax=Undibacterium sp. TJN25 TaxID=3413056 RepID=UPI003BF11885